jgi:hypothetical protein
LLPTPLDVSKIIWLAKDLTKFNSVSLLLRKTNGVVSLVDAIQMFDRVIEDFGDDF